MDGFFNFFDKLSQNTRINLIILILSLLMPSLMFVIVNHHNIFIQLDFIKIITICIVINFLILSVFFIITCTVNAIALALQNKYFMDSLLGMQKILNIVQSKNEESRKRWHEIKNKKGDISYSEQYVEFQETLGIGEELDDLDTELSIQEELIADHFYELNEQITTYKKRRVDIEYRVLTSSLSYLYISIFIVVFIFFFPTKVYNINSLRILVIGVLKGFTTAVIVFSIVESITYYLQTRRVLNKYKIINGENPHVKAH